MLLQIQPIYGWGWGYNDTPPIVPTPERFEVIGRQDETGDIHGRVTSKGHDLCGATFEATPRMIKDAIFDCAIELANGRKLIGYCIVHGAPGEGPWW